MLFAKIGGTRMRATPRTRAACPQCDGEVRSQCGEIVSWHWAHLKSECTSQHEPEKEWHRSWKLLAPEDCCEVVIGRHRADIQTKKGLVIELQHSRISPKTIRERESSYRQMVWIVDASDFRDRVDLRQCCTTHYDDELHYVWSSWRASWGHARAPVFLDVGDGLLCVRGQVGQSGIVASITYERFCRENGLKEKVGTEGLRPMNVSYVSCSDCRKEENARQMGRRLGEIFRDREAEYVLKQQGLRASRRYDSWQRAHDASGPGRLFQLRELGYDCAHVAISFERKRLRALREEKRAQEICTCRAAWSGRFMCPPCLAVARKNLGISDEPIFYEPPPPKAHWTEQL